MSKRLVVGLSLIALLISTSGCEPIRRAFLVGTWSLNNEVILTLSEDATMSVHIKTGSWGLLVPTDIYCSGTWRVNGDRLIWKLTKTSYGGTGPGLMSNQKIVEYDRDYFIVLNKYGKDTYTRVR